VIDVAASSSHFGGSDAVAGLAYVPTRRATASDNRKAEAAGSYLSGAVQIDTRAFDAKAISLPCESHSFDSTAPTPDGGRSLFAHEAAMGTHLHAARGVTAGESAMFRQLFAASANPSRGAVRPLFATGSLLAALAIASPVWAAPPEGSYRGNAFGTFASADAGPVAATLGRSAYLPCSCRGTDGKLLRSQVDAISAGENGRVLRLDGVVTTALTDEVADQALLTTTARVEGLNMFNGMIRGAELTAAANVTATAADISTDAEGTQFVGLRVAGKAVNRNVEPNTKLALPGIGSVIVNSVRRGGGSITVEGLIVRVEMENDFDLPVGAKIIVAHAQAGFSRKVHDVVVGGGAWAAEGEGKIGNQLANRIGKSSLT
jgi:hypothetical protein